MTSPPLNVVFYFDSSALVKRYVTEVGSTWVIALCNPSSNNTIATAQITKAEAAAAFASKYRSGSWPQADYTAALQDPSHDFAHEFLLVDIDQALVDLAVDLTQRQKLRGYDAIQLAAALTLNNILVQQAQSSSFTFITADADLLQAAQNESLLTENPNLRP